MNTEQVEVLLIAGEDRPPNPLREEELAVVLDKPMRIARLTVVERNAAVSKRNVRWLLGRGVCPKPGIVLRRLQVVSGTLAKICDGLAGEADYRQVEGALSGWSHAELSQLMLAEEVIGDPNLRTKVAHDDRLVEAQQAVRALRDEGITLVDPEHLDLVWKLHFGIPS